MAASGRCCWVLVRHLVALDPNEALLFSAIPIGEAAADNMKRLPAVRIDRVRAKKAEGSGHSLFVLLGGASRAVVGGKFCSTRANYVDGEITISGKDELPLRIWAEEVKLFAIDFIHYRQHRPRSGDVLLVHFASAGSAAKECRAMQSRSSHGSLRGNASV